MAVHVVTTVLHTSFLAWIMTSVCFSGEYEFSSAERNIVSEIIHICG